MTHYSTIGTWTCCLLLLCCLGVFADEQSPPATEGPGKAAPRKENAAPAKKKGKSAAAAKRKKGAAGQSPADVRLKPAANHGVQIPRKALGREFLLSASVIPQFRAPTSKASAGRIVIFRRFHDAVDLYESTKGQVVTDDLPARRLLTSFPIVAEDDQHIVIDFNQGMKRVFNESWYANSRYSPSALTEVLEVPQSRVFSVVQRQDRLEIRQSVQVRNRQVRPNQEARYEVRYFLSPYVRGRFKSKENLSRFSRYVRFFQTHAELELETGRSTARIARFDIRQPLVFYYSANTPKDYVQAVEDGILYWNRAFGRDVIQVRRAPRKVTAPSPDHNMVQWVPWDNAGSAYADLILDPRTGRAYHGQAYLTSVFAVNGKQRARTILRSLEPLAEQDEDPPEQTIGISFLEPASACEVNRAEFARHLAAGMAAMLAAGDVDDQRILQASQDYVRNVTAHEVGHVLGLRHNFAGSLAATIGHAELNEWFHKYLTDEELPALTGKLTTSSVMEYNTYRAAVFNGFVMRTSKDALPHDKAAIQWGYFDKTTVKDEKLLFGSDDEVGTYGDVVRFDYGPEPIVAGFANISSLLRTLPHDLLETFIQAKAPRDPRDRVPLEEVNLDADRRVRDLVRYYRDMFRWFNAKTRSLRLERDFTFVDQLNEEEMQKKRWESLNEQVDKLGGVDRMAFSFLPLPLTLDLKQPPQGVQAPEKFDVDKMNEKLAQLLESDAYATFVGADGKRYRFSEEEMALIRRRGAAYFERFERELVKQIVTALGSVTRDLGTKVQGSVADDDVVADLEKQILAVAKVVVMTKDEDRRIRGKLGKSIVEVIDFQYDMDTRTAAAKMLADNVGSFPAWSQDARTALNKQLKEDVDSALNINNLKEFKQSQLSRPLRQWYLQQQRLLSQLPAAK